MENKDLNRPEIERSSDQIGIFGIPLYGQIPNPKDYIQGPQRWSKEYFKKETQDEEDLE